MDSSNPENRRTDANHEECMTQDNSGKRKETESVSKARAAKKVQNTRSSVWSHFTRTEDDRNKCICHYCKKVLSCSTKSGTSNLRGHLLICDPYKTWAEGEKQTIINNEGTLSVAKVPEHTVREATNELMVLGQLPLSFIESMAWKHFCNKVNLYKPTSRRTATRDIMEMFVKRKEVLKKWISSNKQRVSLTTDIWVAQVTGASYMVITAHFVDANWQLKKLIIGFKYVTDHKGQTISNILIECLAEWGIEKVFCITVDNASANGSALKKFHREFSALNADSLVLDGDYMHMRCSAHIINLVAKEGLTELGDSVTAIRNGIQYVRSSTARLNSFELRVDTGNMTRGSLPMDVKTRWNSTFLMLSRAIQYKLAFHKMEAEDKLYNDYFLELENGKKRPGPPSNSDWDAVEKLVRFLVIFYNSTLTVSASSTVNSYKCYGEIDEIGVADARDELEIYLKEPVENPKLMIGTEYNVLSWWKANSVKFPILSEIAKDLLAMQVSSVASESAFSTSGRVLDPYRSCLTHYMIEALMCTEQWMKADIQMYETTFVTNEQMLADVELLDKLEKLFRYPDLQE